MKQILFFIFIFSIPTITEAVFISEVMYDLEGADTGREWVEVYNDGSTDVDLSLWKFFEEGTNHQLNVFQGDGVVPAGEYAVISDNPEKLLLDWPVFSGDIFDSSFSLKNTGELLVLKDGELVEMDQVDYKSEWGAGGDGNSLQRIDGQWQASKPTLGGQNLISANVVETNNTNNQENGGGSSNNEDLSGGEWVSDNGKITAFAGDDKQVVVGADALYEGQALGTKNMPLENARFVWSFGDGGMLERRNVLYAYSYPGDYIVVLNVSSGKYASSDRIRVKALPADIIISNIETGTNSFIELYNRSNFELNLSWWTLRAGEQFFILPKDTILAKGAKVSFPLKVTGLNILDKKSVALLYPNGSIAVSYVGNNEALLAVRSDSGVLAENNKSYSEEERQKLLPVPTIVQKESNVPVYEEENQLASANIALDREAVPDGDREGGGGIYKWLVGLFSVVFIAILGFILASKEADEADGIEIVE